MSNKPGDIKQDDYGKLIWRQPSDGGEGWWSRIEDEETTKLRVPMACPCCNILIDNWSNNFYHRWGVCSNCYYDYLDGREDLPKFDSNKDRAHYCLQKKTEKEKIK